MKTIIALAILLACSAYASAEPVSVTNTAPPSASVKIGSATLSPSVTTIYSMPGKGPDGGAIPGNQRGSSVSSTGGVTVKIPLSSGKK